MLHWYCKATYNLGQIFLPKATYNLGQIFFPKVTYNLGRREYCIRDSLYSRRKSGILSKK